MSSADAEPGNSNATRASAADHRASDRGSIWLRSVAQERQSSVWTFARSGAAIQSPSAMGVARPSGVCGGVGRAGSRRARRRRTSPTRVGDGGGRGLEGQARGRLPARLGDDRRPALPESGRADRGQRREPGIVLPRRPSPTLGTFVLEGQTVRFEPAAGAAVDLQGARVSAPVVLKDDGSGPADELTSGTVKMAVHVSGARRSLRVWDPGGPLARGFKGFTWFPIQTDYRVTGRFIADAAPRTLQVTNTFGDARHLHHGRRRRVHAQRADAAPAAVHHAAQALLHRVQG